MWILFQGVLTWVFRQVVLKFVVLGVLYEVLAWVLPHMTDALGAFISASSLDSAFSAMTPGMWYFFDLFGLGTGIPLILSAMVSKFLIRRLPVVG